MHTSNSGLGENQLFSQIGMYKGNIVAVKKLDKCHITLERDENKELTAVGASCIFFHCASLNDNLLR